MDWLKFHHPLLIGLLAVGLVYSCAPVGLTSQLSTEATPTLGLHTPVTDCPANLVHDSPPQAGYQEWLFLGLTSREEVEERLGEPDSRSLYNRVWYEESEEDHYTFLQIQYNDGIATSLMTNDTGLSLGQALEMYGCPDFIYGTWSSEHGFGPFVVDTVSIIYLDAGVLVSLPTPFDINSPLDLLETFLPTPLETLIASHQHLDHPAIRER